MRSISLELFFNFPLSYKEKRIKSLVRVCSTVMEKEGRYSKIIFALLLHRIIGFINHIICVIGVFISNLAQRDGPKAIHKDLFRVMRGV